MMHWTVASWRAMSFLLTQLESAGTWSLYERLEPHSLPGKCNTGACWAVPGIGHGGVAIRTMALLFRNLAQPWASQTSANWQIMVSMNHNQK
jgi:hypothetical protein